MKVLVFDKNTTGLSDAKYQATFVFDASNLSKEVDKFN